MDASPSALAKFLLPKTPFILKTALLHTLSFSDTSSKWDLRSELTIKILRQMLGPDTPSTSITKMQRLTTKDPGIKGNLWVAKIKVDVDGHDGGESVREGVWKAIRDMDVPGQPANWTIPPSKPLEAEWVGFKAEGTKETPEPTGLTEEQKYAALEKETTSQTTILYFHGGAMYLLDPSTYRNNTSKLAHTTGGKVFSVRYRLAPQNPFPAALLDALNSYLTLVYPPPGTLHAPIPAENIIFAGDSAGGMLCASLLQLLLQLRRSQTPLTFHSQSIPNIPLPAGLALLSPWLDVTRSLPSIESLAKFDYLPPPSHTENKSFPHCEAWPTTPPRADLYCEGSAMLHPLVSPLAAKDWTGSPPVLFTLGEEMLRDEDACVAKKMHEQGVKVVYREFEAMPHVFPYMLEWLPATGVHFEEVKGFCEGVVGNGAKGVQGSCQIVKAKSLERKEVGFEKLETVSEVEVERLMRETRGRLEAKARSEGLGEGSVEARPML